MRLCPHWQLPGVGAHHQMLRPTHPAPPRPCPPPPHPPWPTLVCGRQANKMTALRMAASTMRTSKQVGVWWGRGVCYHASAAAAPPPPHGLPCVCRRHCAQTEPAAGLLCLHCYYGMAGRLGEAVTPQRMPSCHPNHHSR